MGCCEFLHILDLAFLEELELQPDVHLQAFCFRTKVEPAPLLGALTAESRMYDANVSRFSSPSVEESTRVGVRLSSISDSAKHPGPSCIYAHVENGWSP